MAHSKRLHFKIVFLLLELVVFFLGTVLIAYYGAIQNWDFFWISAIISILLFAILRVIEAKPSISDYLAFEDRTAQMTKSAEKFGIIRLYNMHEQTDQNARNSDTIAEIQKADVMYLCANSGASYLAPRLYRHWPAIEARLKKNIPFKIVLLDPFSNEKSFRNMLNNQEGNNDAKLNLNNLIEIYNQYPQIEIKFAKHGMHATIFSTPKCLFYDPYHSGKSGNKIDNRSFCLKVIPVDTLEEFSYFHQFNSHFHALWESSSDIETWIVENKNKLSEETPTIKKRHEYSK